MFLLHRYRLIAMLSALLFALGCTSTSTPPESEAAEESAPVAKTSDSNPVAVGQASARLEPVYFDTDEAILRANARDSLEGYAKSILDHPEWGVVTIDGHCDERGSDEHNQALGRRRASAVERYLVEMGVPPARMAIRTFGENKPAVRGHHEEAWSYNRRSELRVEEISSASL